MTATVIQMQRQAIAVQRALECAEILAPSSEPLANVKGEHAPDDAYALAEAVVVLGRTCLQQREHIAQLGGQIEEQQNRVTELAERVEALEAKE